MVFVLPGGFIRAYTRVNVNVFRAAVHWSSSISSQCRSARCVVYIVLSEMALRSIEIFVCKSSGPATLSNVLFKIEKLKIVYEENALASRNGRFLKSRIPLKYFRGDVPNGIWRRQRKNNGVSVMA